MAGACRGGDSGSGQLARLSSVTCRRRARGIRRDAWRATAKRLGGGRVPTLGQMSGYPESADD